MLHWPIRQAVRILRQGGLIAYPTETVYGLGCDPFSLAAIRRLLFLKQRSPDKGLILLASDLDMLDDFVAVSAADRAVLLSEPDVPTTWLVPARSGCPYWLTGCHSTVAVRLSGHSVVQQLCRAFQGALVSTSANLKGRPPITRPLVLRNMLRQVVDAVVPGTVDPGARPSRIVDLRSGAVLRES